MRHGQTLMISLSKWLASRLRSKKAPLMSEIAPFMSAPDQRTRTDLLMRSVFDRFIATCQPDIICDIGSYNADEVVRFRKLSPRSACFAFEANELNVEQFMKPRPDLGNIVIEHMAVSDRSGETTFNLLEAESREGDWRRAAGSLLERSQTVPAELDLGLGLGSLSARAVTVRCTKLDDYFRSEIAVGKTFILWIDVEGALFNIIQGAQATLQRTILLRAEVERYQFWKDQKLAADNVAALKKAGLILLADNFTEGSYPQSDALFINENWLALATKT